MGVEPAGSGSFRPNPAASLTKLESKIVAGQGLTTDVRVSSVLGIAEATVTRVLTPQPRTDAVQDIDVSFDANVDTSVNWLVMLTRVLPPMLITAVVLGALSGNPFMILGLLIVALVLFAIIIIVDAFVFLPGVEAAIINIFDQVDRPRKNATDFTIQAFRYDEAQIMVGSLASPSYSLDMAPSVVYYDDEAALKVSLINQSGAANKLSTTSDDPTVIRIDMPDFLAADLGNMTITLPGWDLSIEDGALLLTNTSQESWEPGPDNAIEFEVQGVICTTQKPPAGTGFVEVAITNTERVVPPMAARLSYQQTPPDYHTILWNALNDSANGFSAWKDMQGNPATSGSKDISSVPGGFIPLATAEQLINDGPQAGTTIQWQLGYSNGPKGTVATMVSEKNKQYAAQFGTTPESGTPSQVYYLGMPSNAGFSLNYQQD